jgi:hypothetical protein
MARRNVSSEWREVLQLAASSHPTALTTLREIARREPNTPHGMLAERVITLWRGDGPGYTSDAPIEVDFRSLSASELRLLSPRRSADSQSVLVSVDVDAAGRPERVTILGVGPVLGELERLVACRAWSALYCPVRKGGKYQRGNIVIRVMLDIR